MPKISIGTTIQLRTPKDYNETDIRKFIISFGQFKFDNKGIGH